MLQRRSFGSDGTCLRLAHPLDHKPGLNAALVDIIGTQLRSGLAWNGALLGLDHFHVLLEDATLLSLEPLGESGVLNAEIASPGMPRHESNLCGLGLKTEPDHLFEHVQVYVS
jgi:hypothetical protein